MDLTVRLTKGVAQKIQRDYKAKISSQSKKNFLLEKDVRYLDSRIALLIQNRMALEEVRTAEDVCGSLTNKRPAKRSCESSRGRLRSSGGLFP